MTISEKSEILQLNRLDSFIVFGPRGHLNLQWKQKGISKFASQLISVWMRRLGICIAMGVQNLPRVRDTKTRDGRKHGTKPEVLMSNLRESL